MDVVEVVVVMDAAMGDYSVLVCWACMRALRIVSRRGFRSDEMDKFLSLVCRLQRSPREKVVLWISLGNKC